MAVSATVTPALQLSEGESLTISKLNQMASPTVDISGAVGSLSLADGSVTNAKVAVPSPQSNGVAFNKLTSLATGELIIGNAGTPTATTLSGDATIAADGAITVSSSATVTDDAITLAKLQHGTQGDILYWGHGGAPVLLGYGADGQFLKTTGHGGNPAWATVTPSIKAIRSEIAGSDTYYGTADIDNGATNLATGTAISLDASSSYYLEWAVNVAEDTDPTGATDSMDGEVQISTDGAAYTKMFDVKLYERRTGGSGMAQHRTCHVGFCHKLITNSTGGNYYFRFETNDGTLWHVHDFSLKVMEGVDYAGQTHTQA